MFNKFRSLLRKYESKVALLKIDVFTGDIYKVAELLKKTSFKIEDKNEALIIAANSIGTRPFGQL
jgi:hypothetical protein